MTDYNKQPEETDECECPTCSLVSEFKEMIEDDVDWESALRHILNISSNYSEAIMVDLIDDIYIDAYEDGVLFGIEQSQRFMDSFVEDTADKIYEARDRRENPEDYVDEAEDEIKFEDKYDEKLEDLSDEQFDYIQKQIRKGM